MPDWNKKRVNITYKQKLFQVAFVSEEYKDSKLNTSQHSETYRKLDSLLEDIKTWFKED